MDSLIACGNKVLGAAVPREAPETQQHWPLFEGVSVAVGYVESKASKVAGQADKRDKDLQRKSHADVKRQLKWLLGNMLVIEYVCHKNNLFPAVNICLTRCAQFCLFE